MPLMNLPEQHHKQAFMQAIERFKITEQELEDGFWKAYADHYTPSTGIEFKHIFKHVKETRENSKPHQMPNAGAYKNYV